VTADLYPRFGLSGNLGWETVDFLNPGKGVTYTIAPFLKWNVFNRGLIKNNIHAQEEVTQQELLGYEQSVLVAIVEVENTMVSYREERERHANLAHAVGATECGPEWKVRSRRSCAPRLRGDDGCVRYTACTLVRR